jgi:hypothetical protein
MQAYKNIAKNHSTDTKIDMNTTHRLISKGIQINIQKRYLHTHVYFSSIHNGPLWSQWRCPTTNEWIKKILYIYIMEYYSTLIKNKIMSFARKWMELEIIMLSEISQAQKAKYHVLTFLWNLDLKWWWW